MSQPMGHRIAAGVLAGVMALGPGRVAWAQKPTDKSPATAAADIAAAKKHYAEGEKKLKAEDFEGALVEFQAANDIKSAPQSERNIGICEDNLGHFPSAVEWYEKFLAHVPDKLAAQGDEIKKRVAVIQAMPGKVHVDSNPPGAAVTIDGKPQAGVTPIETDLPPGSHELKLTEAGRLPGGKTIDVAFATPLTVSIDLDPEPPPPPPPPPPVAVAPPAPAPAPVPVPPATPTEQRSVLPAYITGGLAIAAAGVGTVFGVMALNDKSDFDKNPTTSTADNGDTHSLIADMCFGVAITFGVTSAVLFLTHDEPAAAASATPRAPAAEAKREGVTIVPTPVVGPHVAGAGFSMQF
jgi:hypothetical protein